MRFWSTILPPYWCDDDIFAPGFDKTYLYSEDDILDEYWYFWKSRMIQKFGEGHALITKENCIDDWVQVNWAMEVKKND